MHNVMENMHIVNHSHVTVSLTEEAEVLHTPCGKSVTEVIVTADDISVICKEFCKIVVSFYVLAHAVGKLNNADLFNLVIFPYHTVYSVNSR